MIHSAEAAAVLNTTPVNEADLIVTFLSRGLGKGRAYARSARKSQKRFPGGIDIFDCGVFELVSRKNSELWLLDGIHRRKTWPQLRSNLQLFTLGAFCLEIVSSFTAEGDADSGTLFNPLFLSLRALAESVHEAERFAITAYFAHEVLNQSGLGILYSDTLLAPETRQWLTDMQAARKPIVSPELPKNRTGLFELVRYAETLLGHRLNTTRGDSFG